MAEFATGAERRSTESSDEEFCGSSQYLLPRNSNILTLIDKEAYKLQVLHLHDGKLLAMLDKLELLSRDVCSVKRSERQVVVTEYGQIEILAVETTVYGNIYWMSHREIAPWKVSEAVPKVMEALYTVLVEEDNKNSTANKENYMQDKKAKDASRETKFVDRGGNVTCNSVVGAACVSKLQGMYRIDSDNVTSVTIIMICAKDEHKMPLSDALLYTNHEEILNKVQIYEFSKKRLKVENCTLVFILENTLQKRVYPKQQCLENLGADLDGLNIGNRVLLTEKLLETHQGDKSFTKQFNGNFEDETILSIAWNLHFTPFSGCAHDKNGLVIGTLYPLTEHSLRRGIYVFFGQKTPVFVLYFSEEAIYTVHGEAMHTFVSHLKVDSIINQGVKLGKRRKLKKSLEFLCPENANITPYCRNVGAMTQSGIDFSKNILEYLLLRNLHIQNLSLKLPHYSCMGAAITLCSMKTDGRKSVYTWMTNKRQINVVTKYDTVTFYNFILETCSINNAKLDQHFFPHIITYDSGIVLSTPDVRPQPSPSANQETQGRVRRDVFKLISSNCKKKGKENKTQTKSISPQTIEIKSKMFENDLVVVSDVTLDKRENEKHDVDTSHMLVYLDDTKLQMQNTSVNFNEGSREEMDLQRRKKHSLIQMILPHLKELPQPYVHREVIVGFLSGEYSKSPEKVTRSPNENLELGEMLKRLASDEIPGPEITMKFEMLRLCTLKKYPRENKPFAVRLVAAGFYYAGYTDQLICYCCAIRKDNWVSGDIPTLIHQEMSPGCSFLTKNASVNIPMKRHTSKESRSVRLLAILRSDDSNQSDVAQSASSLLLPSSEQKWLNISNTPHQMLVTNKVSTLSQLHASGGQNVLDNRQTVTVHADSVEEPRPKYPQYADRNARKNSFQGWSEELRQRPEEMAECGFYYAGFSDCVRCFYCGVGLRHWMSEDNPWIEHARWSTSCIYVLKMKGEEFISLVQMAVETPERLSVDTTGSTTTIGRVGEATVSTPSSGNTDIQKYLLTDAAQSVLDMGYQPKMVLQAIERVLMKKGTEELTAQIIMETVLDIEEAEGMKIQPPPLTPNTIKSDQCTTKDGHETEGGTTDSNLGVNQEIDPEIIMREHRELRDATLCKVCLDSKICVVFLPCGHFVTCADCAPAMRKCPICRSLVKGTMKAFFG